MLEVNISRQPNIPPDRPGASWVDGVVPNSRLGCKIGNPETPWTGGYSLIRMIGMIIVFFRGCIRRFSIFRGCSSEI